MRRVAHLSSHHADDDIRIFRKECRSLVEAGYEVAYVVPTAEDRTADGVLVRSVAVPRSRRDRFLITPWKVLREALRFDADVYHFHDPELMLPGLVLKLMGKRVVYDVHEDLPRQILSKAWVPLWLRQPVSWLAEGLEYLTTRAMDAVVTATPHIAKRFPRGKTQVVQNFPIIGELATESRVPHHERPPTFIYVGGITGIRGLRECVEAIGILNERVAAKLVLAGNFESDALLKELQAMPGWAHVDHKGFLSRAEVASLLAESRAGLVMFHPVPNHVNAQPNKLFEYMSAGLPVIASDFPAWRELFDAAGCGHLVDPFDTAALAATMQGLLEDPAEAQRMGERGAAAVRERFNWDREAKELLAVYERIAPRTSPAAT